MNVLIVGSGAREHALLWKLARSNARSRFFCAPGNAGTAALAENIPIAATDVDSLTTFARQREIDLVVVGPEAPLAAGLTDALRAQSIAAFGPSAAAARLEASKSFAKLLMRDHGIPTAHFEVFDDAAQADAFLRGQREPWVVKADGLAGGKGVVVPETHEEARAAIENLMLGGGHGGAGRKVVLEERLRGPEVSYHVLSDGQRYVALAASQDHKRLLAGDRGPNTGGMGAYSPAPGVDVQVDTAIRRAIVEPTLQAMASDGTPFRGVLFIGLMIVDGVPKVIEYNVRFGDPETQGIMVRLDCDLMPWLLGTAHGELPSGELTWGAPAAMTVVLAADGYPHAANKGAIIEGIEAASGVSDVNVFEAGTRAVDGQKVVNGGRVLSVTARGEDVDAAARVAYQAVSEISFEGMQFRSDIGWQARKIE